MASLVAAAAGGILLSFEMRRRCEDRAYRRWWTGVSDQARASADKGVAVVPVEEPCALRAMHKGRGRYYSQTRSVVIVPYCGT